MPLSPERRQIILDRLEAARQHRDGGDTEGRHDVTVSSVSSVSGLTGISDSNESIRFAGNSSVAGSSAVDSSSRRALVLKLLEERKQKLLQQQQEGKVVGVSEEYVVPRQIDSRDSQGGESNRGGPPSGSESARAGLHHSGRVDPAAASSSGDYVGRQTGSWNHGGASSAPAADDGVTSRVPTADFLRPHDFQSGRSRRVVAKPFKFHEHPKGKTREDLILERENELKKECTFQPKISRRGDGVFSSQTTQERLEKLAQPKTNVFQERERTRREEELREVHTSCTFKPAVRRISGTATNANETVEDRLLRQAEVLRKKKLQAQKQQEEEVMEQFSFAPDVHTAGYVDPESYRPIYNRVGELQRKKKDQLLKLRHEQEEHNPDLTFRPKINANSGALKDSNVDRTRLYNDVAQHSNRLAAAKASAEWDVVQECTFQPQISAGSEYILNDSSVFPARKNFLERQNDYKKKALVRKRRRAQQQEEEINASFRPRINPMSDLLAAGARRSAGEAKEKAKEAAQKEYSKKYTFQPSINKRSRALAKGYSTDDLASAERHQKIQRDIAVASEEAFARAHPFAPQIAAKQRASNAKVKTKSKLEADQIDKDRQEHQRKMEELRDKKRAKEQAECTFQPKTNKGKRKKNADAVYVRGLSRFLELKELKKKQDAERAEREARAFSVNPSALGGKVKPPRAASLSKGPTGENRKKIQKDRDRENTFRPKTNSGSNRALIERLLEEDWDQPLGDEDDYIYDA